MAFKTIAKTDTLETFRTEFNALCLNDFGDIADLSGAISATTLVGAMNETISIATSTAGFTIRDSSSTTQLIGGGDTLLAINIAGINFDQFHFVSTAGGAFLEALEDKQLPGVEALNLS